MEWIQVLTVIGVNIALFGAFASLVVWVMNKLDSDIKALGTQIESSNRRLDGHAVRIDQLYQMFVDLLKEKRK